MPSYLRLPNSATLPWEKPPCSSLSLTHEPTNPPEFPVDGKRAKSPIRPPSDRHDFLLSLVDFVSCQQTFPSFRSLSSLAEPDTFDPGSQAKGRRPRLLRLSDDNGIQISTTDRLFGPRLDAAANRPDRQLTTILQLTAGTLTSQTDRSSLFLDAVARLPAHSNKSTPSSPDPSRFIGQDRLVAFFKLRFAAAPPRFAPRLPPQQESESIPQTATDKSHWATPRTRLTVPLWRATDTRRLLPASQLYRGPALLCHINPSGAHEGRIQNIATQHRFVHAAHQPFPIVPFPFRWLGVFVISTATPHFHPNTRHTHLQLRVAVCISWIWILGHRRPILTPTPHQ